MINISVNKRPVTSITLEGTGKDTDSYKLLKEHIRKMVGENLYDTTIKLADDIIHINNVKIEYTPKKKNNVLSKIKKLQHKQKIAYCGLYDTRWNRWRKYSQNEIIKSITNGGKIK